MIDDFLNHIQTMTPALILTLGLAVGLQHAFEPDHISAVTTQISKGKYKTQAVKLQIIYSWSTLGSRSYNNIGYHWFTFVSFFNQHTI
jgi:high-affinity nickel permease